ncbi:MAG: NAD-dependent epimerase/dehydratase family protein [Anaerolineae bacterium]|nr:NAD-dependent epimerase/dehydratase family protein [Phycisphaerae bacterium]
MRLLVTGGAGFIGSNLAKKLLADGHETVAADDFSSASWTNLTDFRGDVFTLELFKDIKPLRARGPFDVIFHQASITDTTVDDQKKMMQNNVEAFRNILDLAVEWKCRVVWASSCSIYGQGAVPMKESQPPDPLNVYAFSKLAMERLADKYRAQLAHPIVGLRYSNVYGPGEAHKGKFSSMIHQLAKQMRSGKRPRIFRAGEQKRDFVYIDDIVQANLRGMQSRTSGSFNAGAGASWSFNEVIAQLNRVLGTKLQPEFFENPYSFTQEWTQTDLTESTRHLGYVPQFDLIKGMTAYHESGKLGI